MLQTAYKYLRKDSNALVFCRLSSGRILEALHVDPASGVSVEKEKSTTMPKPTARYDIVFAKKKSNILVPC